MTRLAIAALALGALTTTFVVPAGASQPSTPPDQPCGFTSVTDRNPEAPEDTRTGYIDGGPIFQNGTITCTIQVAGDSHDDADNATAASAHGTLGFTYASPTLVSYVAPRLTPVYLCTQFTGDDDRVTWYVDGTTGEWTTNRTAACHLTISGGAADPLFDLLDSISDMLVDIEKDVIEICPFLAALGGLGADVAGVLEINSQGDIFLAGQPFWDCPPYDLYG